MIEAPNLKPGMLFKVSHGDHSWRLEYRSLVFITEVDMSRHWVYYKEIAFFNMTKFTDSEGAWKSMKTNFSHWDWLSADQNYQLVKKC